MYLIVIPPVGFLALTIQPIVPAGNASTVHGKHTLLNIVSSDHNVPQMACTSKTELIEYIMYLARAMNALLTSLVISF